MAAAYETPSYLLLVAVAALSLVEAACARRAGSHGSGWGLVASAVGLFGALAMVGTVAADNAMVPHSPGLSAAAVVGAAIVSVTAYLLGRRRPGGGHEREGTAPPVSRVSGSATSASSTTR
jgi:hypothetical protein